MFGDPGDEQTKGEISMPEELHDNAMKSLEPLISEWDMEAVFPATSPAAGRTSS